MKAFDMTTRIGETSREEKEIFWFFLGKVEMTLALTVSWLLVVKEKCVAESRYKMAPFPKTTQYLVLGSNLSGTERNTFLSMKETLFRFVGKTQ